MELLFMAWRNVFRNRRRTILNVIALSIGIIMAIIGMGWMRGYETGLFKSMINFETGHIQVLRKNYLEQERRFPLDIMIPRYPDLITRFKQDPRILEITPRVNYTAKVSFEGKSRYLAVKGIDPERESRVTILHTIITSGHYLDREEGILMGKPLAERFGLVAGDSVALTADTKYASEETAQENFIYAKVVGIFSYGYPAIDENVIFADMHTTSGLLLLDNEATRLVIRLKDGFEPAAILPNVQKAVADTDLKAYSWERFAQVVVSAVRADGSSFGGMFLIIYILIIIGIMNSMSMSVQERIQEIGTLRAIGMKRRTLLGLFLGESVCIAGIGIAISLAVGGTIALLLQYVGFNFGDYMPADIPIPFGEKFYCDFRWHDFLTAILFGSLTALIAGFVPARRAAKTVIARAMGTLALK